MARQSDMLLLARLIEAEVRREFEEVHLSKNLMETIQVVPTQDSVEVRIPAVRYDIPLWYDSHIVVHRPEQGSYAEQVNLQGGFSGLHKLYAERAIRRAIRTWSAMLGVKIKKQESDGWEAF